MEVDLLTLEFEIDTLLGVEAVLYVTIAAADGPELQDASGVDVSPVPGA